jgi:hypothetical protein
VAPSRRAGWLICLLYVGARPHWLCEVHGTVREGSDHKGRLLYIKWLCKSISPGQINPPAAIRGALPNPAGTGSNGVTAAISPSSPTYTAPPDRTSPPDRIVITVPRSTNMAHPPVESPLPPLVMSVSPRGR